MNTFAKRIEQEANNLIKNLHGSDVARIRRQLIAFHAKTMKVASGADSIVDPILLKLIESKYTTAIVVSVVAAIFCAGLML